MSQKGENRRVKQEIGIGVANENKEKMCRIV